MLSLDGGQSLGETQRWRGQVAQRGRGHRQSRGDTGQQSGMFVQELSTVSLAGLHTSTFSVQSGFDTLGMNIVVPLETLVL